MWACWLGICISAAANLPWDNPALNYSSSMAPSPALGGGGGNGGRHNKREDEKRDSLQHQQKFFTMKRYCKNSTRGQGHPQSRQSAKLFLQSSELGLPHPLTGRRVCVPLPPLVPGGGGGGHTGRRDRHSGTLGKYVLCDDSLFF
jgi:hypothetical protein